jgi:hypothetical protein
MSNLMHAIFVAQSQHERDTCTAAASWSWLMRSA